MRYFGSLAAMWVEDGRLSDPELQAERKQQNCTGDGVSRKGIPKESTKRASHAKSSRISHPGGARSSDCRNTLSKILQ